jgi:hypothetical protein
MALYLGLLPSLFYIQKQNTLPYQRRSDAIRNYLDSPVTLDGIVELLKSTLTGEYEMVPRNFREFLDIEVVNQREVAHWIPYHLCAILYSLSCVHRISAPVRQCLKAICSHFGTFHSHKVQSGDGWESLFVIVLLTRCLTKEFGTLVPVPAAFGDVEVPTTWNQPFIDSVNFHAEKVDEFVGGIPVQRQEKSIAVYFPTNAKFQAYDVILAYWGEDKERKLIGYQLKEDSTLPKDIAMEQLFKVSYVIRGAARNKDFCTRRWTIPSDQALAQFFGDSAWYWTPKYWTALKNGEISCNCSAFNDPQEVGRRA